jgi:hypothetical protein
MIMYVRCVRRSSTLVVSPSFRFIDDSSRRTQTLAAAFDRYRV